MSQPAQSATILGIRPLSPHVQEWILQPSRPISYAPGQWISLQLPVGDHPPLVRAYSMAEPESASNHLVLAFDRIPGGLATEYLFSRKEGDQVVLSGPFGRFVLPEQLPSNLVLIARYTGIVPIRCMLLHLFSAYQATRIVLSYNAPRLSELIYDSEFTRLTSHSNFLYLPHISGMDEGLERPVRDWAIVQSLAPHIIEKDFMPLISGIKAFVSPLRGYFSEQGFERRHIRTETYD
jgi:ferredoxin-NADP reductase